MGDMADYTIELGEQEALDNELGRGRDLEDSDFLEKRDGKFCKWCCKGNLQWLIIDHRWRLCDGAVPHACVEFERAKSVADRFKI